MRTILAKLAPRAFALTTEHSGAVLSNGLLDRRSRATAPKHDTKNSRQIRVTSEFMIRSRRGDEKSYVELDEISGKSGLDHGGLYTIHASSDSTDQIYTTVEVRGGGGTAASGSANDNQRDLYVSPTRSRHELGDLTADAQIISRAYPADDKRAHAETSISLV